MLGRGKSKSNGSMGLFYIPRMTRDGGIFTDDSGGYIFSQFFKTLADEKGVPLPRLALKMPDSALNEYVRNYGLVAVVRDHEGSTLVWSVNYLNRLPHAFTDRLRRSFGIMPDSTVLWSDDVFKEPKEMPAREVIFGERPEKPGRETKSQKQKKWANPSPLNKGEWDYLKGKSNSPD